MFELAKVARRLARYELLSSKLSHEKVIDCVNGIRFDTYGASVEGFSSGLRRIVEHISQMESRALEFLSLEQCRVRANAYRQMGFPPCYTIHKDLECHCCCFLKDCFRCIKSTEIVEDVEPMNESKSNRQQKCLTLRANDNERVTMEKRNTQND